MWSIQPALAFASNCSQGAYSDGPNWQCKQNRPRRAVFITLISLRKFGAGEGIRTLDPNLGKVVLCAPKSLIIMMLLDPLLSTARVLHRMTARR
jgi:hypothetical protein